MTPNWLDVILAFGGGWLLRVAADPWLRPVPSTPPLGEPHVWLSSACLHEQHVHCTRRCPFCPSLCQCVCHRGQAVEPDA